MPDNLQLNNLLQQLRLPGIADSLDSRLRQAKESSMSYEELLSMLFQDELENKNQSMCGRWIVLL